jgi:hypothetical protein
VGWTCDHCGSGPAPWSGTQGMAAECGNEACGKYQIPPKHERPRPLPDIEPVVARLTGYRREWPAQLSPFNGEVEDDREQG